MLVFFRPVADPERLGEGGGSWVGWSMDEKVGLIVAGEMNAIEYLFSFLHELLVAVLGVRWREDVFESVVFYLVVLF